MAPSSVSLSFPVTSSPAPAPAPGRLVLKGANTGTTSDRLRSLSLRLLAELMERSRLDSSSRLAAEVDSRKCPNTRAHARPRLTSMAVASRAASTAKLLLLMNSAFSKMNRKNTRLTSHSVTTCTQHTAHSNTIH